MKNKTTNTKHMNYNEVEKFQFNLLHTIENTLSTILTQQTETFLFRKQWNDTNSFFKDMM